MTAVAPERFTQWICETQPACLCIESPLDGNECACDGEGACSVCEAPLVHIDFETGERVPGGKLEPR